MCTQVNALRKKTRKLTSRTEQLTLKNEKLVHRVVSLSRNVRDTKSKLAVEKQEKAELTKQKKYVERRAESFERKCNVNDILYKRKVRYREKKILAIDKDLNQKRKMRFKIRFVNAHTSSYLNSFHTNTFTRVSGKV